MSWLHQLWFGYVYPSLKGNLPADVFFTLLGLIAGSLIRPYVLKHLRLFHAKLDHLIEHSIGVPPFEDK